jgi:hypothetical protein
MKNAIILSPLVPMRVLYMVWQVDRASLESQAPKLD